MLVLATCNQLHLAKKKHFFLFWWFSILKIDHWYENTHCSAELSISSLKYYFYYVGYIVKCNIRWPNSRWLDTLRITIKINWLGDYESESISATISLSSSISFLSLLCMFILWFQSTFIEKSILYILNSQFKWSIEIISNKFEIKMTIVVENFFHQMSLW